MYMLRPTTEDADKMSVWPFVFRADQEMSAMFTYVDPHSSGSSQRLSLSVSLYLTLSYLTV